LNNKWVREILKLQLEDGSWGIFHSLSLPTRRQHITTEQALRRLQILGLTRDDEPIQRAVEYMQQCINQPQHPIFNEISHDPKIYSDLMLSTWLRLFDAENEAAKPIAGKWVKIIEAAFAEGKYDPQCYSVAYRDAFGKNPRGGRLADFVTFYQIALVRGLLTNQTEDCFLDYVIGHKTGIYYVYDKPLTVLPENFASRQTSWYLAALELLAGFQSAPGKLGFTIDWILKNMDHDGQWDLGPSSKDGVHFPLSDSWQKIEDRRRDCTARVKRLLIRLGAT